MVNINDLLERIESLPIGESSEDWFMKVLLLDLARVFEEHPREACAIGEALMLRYSDAGEFLAELFLRFYEVGYLDGSNVIGHGAAMEWTGSGFV